MASKNPRKVLARAATYLRKHGWVQGEYGGSMLSYQSPSPACAWGAIESVTHDQDVALAAGKLLEKRLRKAGVSLQFPDSPGDYAETNVTHWNDAKGRTADEVISLLEGQPA